MDADDERIEKAVGVFFSEIYKLVQEGKHQEAYDSLGVVIKMAQEDREVIRNKFKVNWV